MLNSMYAIITRLGSDGSTAPAPAPAPASGFRQAVLEASLPHDGLEHVYADQGGAADAGLVLWISAADARRAKKAARGLLARIDGLTLGGYTLEGCHVELFGAASPDSGS